MKKNIFFLNTWRVALNECHNIPLDGFKMTLVDLEKSFIYWQWSGWRGELLATFDNIRKTLNNIRQLFFLNNGDQAGELLAAFEMFERNGCEGNNMVKKSLMTAYLLSAFSSPPHHHHHNQRQQGARQHGQPAPSSTAKGSSWWTGEGRFLQRLSGEKETRLGKCVEKKQRSRKMTKK